MSKRSYGENSKVFGLPVVAFSDAGADPYTVMVKLRNTVVAHVTVTTPRRSKNVACFAKLELKNKRGISLQQERV